MADESGVSLVETIITVGIVATVLIAIMMALSTATLGVQTVDERVTAQNLAIAQWETLQQASFSSAAHYPLIPSPMKDYDLRVAAVGIAPNLQQITVSVYRNGRFILALEDYKVNR